MTLDDLRRREALLTATLRELLRLADSAETCATCVPLAAALDGDHGRQLADILRKARALVRP
jgi:hypothetical protein